MTTVVRWDPFRELTSLRRELDRVFSRTAGDGPASGQVWSPAVDVFDTPETIVVKAELPGLTTDDIDIELDDNVLTIKGERKFEEKVEEGRYYRLERLYGTFSRSFTLPQSGVKGEDISASFKDGVLEVRVPKAEEVKPRKITVGTESDAAVANGTTA
jgi:HSP20 family protein